MESSTPVARPLAGIRILDFTTFQAGAQGTGILCDLGAEVIKIENSSRGDEARFLYLVGPANDRQSTLFYVFNRGKQSLALDLKRPEAIAVIDRLVASVDVVTSNFRAGTMDRLDLGYDRLRAINPRLVYVSATGWGQRGPKAEHPALDIAAQARSGLIWHTGEEGGSPVPAGANTADATAAHNLAIGVLVGLVARDHTGQSQRIDLSLFGAVLALQAPELTYSMFSGREVPRAGRSHPLVAAITRVFEVADGHVAVMGVEDARWPGFLRAIERPDLGRDERFKDARQRKRNMAALFRELDPLFRARTRAEWMARLEAEDQICSPVQSYQEVAADPVTLENEYLVPFEHPRMGPAKVFTSPFEFNGEKLPTDRVEPLLGEHTRAVLRAAGYSDADIDALLASGAARAS